jgi:hypothetical protein
MSNDNLEIKFLQRIISLVIQRLARASVDWNSDNLFCLQNILFLIDDKNLCLAVSNDDTEVSSGQTLEGYQLMCFIIDNITKLRKFVIHNHSMMISATYEVIIFDTTFKIILKCMTQVTSESSVDRICNEILAYLQFISDFSGFKTTEKKYKSIVLDIFFHLQVVLKDEKLSILVKDRYSSLLFSVIHYFIDLRYNMNNNLSKLCDHVLPIINNLMGKLYYYTFI